jgi:DNA-binding Lrp family transcriptional regulator
VVEIVTKMDLEIIAHLRNDARKSLTAISKETKIPVSTIFDRIKNKSKNIITKNTCLMDFSKVGMNTRAQIALKTIPKERKELREYLDKHKHVNSLYKINNGYDYLVDVVFANLKELEEFLEFLEDEFRIRTKHVFYVIEEIRREEFMNDPNTVGLLHLLS